MRGHQRPDNEVPVSIALDAVLGETADFIVYVSGVRVFRTVLEFRLTALARHRGAGRGLSGALFGHGEPEDRLLLGVEYADGRTGSNLGGFRTGLNQELDPTTPVLMPGGGGGGDRSAETPTTSPRCHHPARYASSPPGPAAASPKPSPRSPPTRSPTPPPAYASSGTWIRLNHPRHRNHRVCRLEVGSTAAGGDPLGDRLRAPRLAPCGANSYGGIRRSS